MGEGRRNSLLDKCAYVKIGDLWGCRHLDDDFSHTRNGIQTSGLPSKTMFV